MMEILIPNFKMSNKMPLSTNSTKKESKIRFVITEKSLKKEDIKK